METNHTEETLLGAFSEVPDLRALYNQKHRFLDILYDYNSCHDLWCRYMG